MAWIILTKKLPTKPAPPKLSIHWAEPWPIKDGSVKDRMNQLTTPRITKTAFDAAGNIVSIDAGEMTAEEAKLNNVEALNDPEDDMLYDDVGFGVEHNFLKAYGLFYKGEKLRVFPDEFNILPAQRMREYVYGIPGEDLPSHDLVTVGNEKDAMLLRTALETDLKSIYDAALIDGCTPVMANMVALGHPVEDETIEFPPIGWYRCKREFAEYWCTDSEMEE